MRHIPDSTQLRVGRTLLGLSTHKLADALGVAYNTVNNAELDKGNPRIDTLTKITAYLEEQGVEFAPGGWVRLTNAVSRKSHRTPGDPE